MKLIATILIVTYTFSIIPSSVAQTAPPEYNYFEFLYRNLYPSYKGDIKKYIINDDPADRILIENRLRNFQTRINFLKHEKIDRWRKAYNYGIMPATAIGVGVFATVATGGILLPATLSFAGVLVLDAGAGAILAGKQTHFEIAVVQEFLKMEKNGFLIEFSKLPINEQVSHLISPDGIIGSAIKNDPKLKAQLYDYILNNSKSVIKNLRKMDAAKQQLVGRQLVRISNLVKKLESLRLSIKDEESGFKDANNLDKPNSDIIQSKENSDWWVNAGHKAYAISTILSEFQKIGQQTGMSEKQLEFLDRASNFANFFVYMGAIAGGASAATAGAGAAAAAGPYAPVVLAVLAVVSLIGAFGKRKKRRRNQALKALFALQVKTFKKLEEIERKIDYNHAIEMATLYKINSDVILNNALIDASLSDETTICRNILDGIKSKTINYISSYYNKYSYSCHLGLNKLYRSGSSVHPIFWMSPTKLNFDSNYKSPILGSTENILILDDGNSIDSFFKKYHHPLWLTINQHLSLLATGLARVPSTNIRDLECKIFDGYSRSKLMKKTSQFHFPYSNQLGLLLDPFYVARSSNMVREIVLLDKAINKKSNKSTTQKWVLLQQPESERLLRVSSDLVDIALLQQSLFLGDTALPVYVAILQDRFEMLTQIGQKYLLPSQRCTHVSAGEAVGETLRNEIQRLLAKSKTGDVSAEKKLNLIKGILTSVVHSTLKQNSLLRRNFIKYFILKSGYYKGYTDADLAYSLLHDAACRSGQMNFLTGLLGDKLFLKIQDGLSRTGEPEYDGTMVDAKPCIVAEHRLEGLEPVIFELPTPFEMGRATLSVTGVAGTLMREKSRILELSSVLEMH